MTTPVTVGRPAAEEAVALYRRWFLNRTDVVAFRAPWGKPQPVTGDEALDGILLAHVLGDAAPPALFHYTNRRGTSAMKGRHRIGSYAPAADHTTRWVCLDLDGDGHAEALADPLAAAREALAAFAAVGLPAYLERSGGGHGWHVWAFFDPPIPAAKAQALGRALAPKAARLADGGVADARSARGIEVFPKQAKLGKKGYGNLVWLPWWREAGPGANLFYEVREGGELVPYVPAFEAAREEDVDRVLAAMPTPEPESARPGPDIALPPSASQSTSDPAWAAWRKAALAALPLESVYWTWLTGESSGPGWLQCRDPASSSGDQNPSAGVADGTGEAERGTFHSFLTGKSIAVFDFLMERGLAPDFRAAMAIVAERSGVPLPVIASPRPEPERVVPRIRVNGRQLREILADAWRVVHATNTRPSLFVRAGFLVRLGRGEAVPRIDAVEEAAVYGHLVRIANWVRVTEDAVLDTTPPKDVARDMLVNPDDELPALEAIVATPVFDSEGRLVSMPGYHKDARLWLHAAPDLNIPAVPEHPSAADVDAARTLLLDELLVDFPFAAGSDRAHAVAALILPFVRRMVDGPTPIHLIEAPTPGSGKGLLADVIAIVAMGRPCDPTTITPDEDEARKKITSILARAQSLILLDNVRDGIDSAQLASALTSETWSDRMLGQTKMVDLPNRATWLVTANNPRLSLEIARRCVRVRLDAKQDRPWQRTGFRHAPLRDWVRAHRPALVHAILVLVQSWIAAGRPLGKIPLGSFEGWAGVMGGILGHAGVEGFLRDTEQLYEQADSDGQEWREFVVAWWDIHGGAWVGTAALYDVARERELLGSVLGDKSERSQKTRLGRALTASRDRQFGPYRLSVGRDGHSKAAQFRLHLDGGDGTAPPAGRSVLGSPVPPPLDDLNDLDALFRA
jgi:hypothetical protein